MADARSADQEPQDKDAYDPPSAEDLEAAGGTAEVATGTSGPGAVSR